MAEVYVFFADGFEEIEGLTVVDLLRRAKVPVHMVSIQGKQAKGSHGIVIETEIGIAEVPEQIGDYLVLPGGMPGTKHLAACEALKEKLLAAEKKGVHLAAICAAPSVFGNLGLLEGKKAVCYPGFEEQLKGSIEPGKLADFVVIDRDYMKCPEEEIKDICSLQTVVGGEVVYETK